MKTYPVTGPDMLEPMWFNRVRQGQHAATVGADRAVTVEGVSLRLRAESPEPGTPVRVWLNHAGFFVCATVADIEQAAAEQRAAEAAREQERRARLDRARAEAEARERSEAERKAREEAGSEENRRKEDGRKKEAGGEAQESGEQVASNY